MAGESCCDYRDHSPGPCACPDHHRSELHPFGSPQPRIAIACSFYFTENEHRAEITRRVFRSFLPILDANPNAVFVGVGSEGVISERLFWEVFLGRKAEYREYYQDFEHPPSWGSKGLRDKFNYAVTLCRAYDPDWTFHVGSDDLAPLATYAPPDEGFDVVGLGGGSYFWQYLTGQYQYIAHPQPLDVQCSGGPLGFSRRYLDGPCVNWLPFSKKGCEQGAEMWARSLGYKVQAHPWSLWQVKGPEVINHMSLFQRYSPQHLPSDHEEVRRFRKWWESLA